MNKKKRRKVKEIKPCAVAQERLGEVMRNTHCNTHVRLTEAESALEGFPDTISIAESGIRVKRIRCHLSPYVA